MYGEGPLGASAERLQRLPAEVVNRWLTDEEIAGVLTQYDAVVLRTLRPASPAWPPPPTGRVCRSTTTPVGGLAEQVLDGVTGTLAARVDAAALADAAKRLLLDPQLCRHCCATFRSARRSMRRFVDEIVALARTHRDPRVN